MSPKKRKLFAEKLAELGNLAAAGLVFAQFFLGIAADRSTIYLGIILFLLCYIAAFLLSE